MPPSPYIYNFGGFSTGLIPGLGVSLDKKIQTYIQRPRKNLVGASKISQFYQVLPVEGDFWLPDTLHAILYGPCQVG